MKKCVNDEVRRLMEEQFADCTTFEETALLFSDFEKILGELLRARHDDLINDIQEN